MLDNENEQKQRGERLKKARNMANLSREQICSKGINQYTYKGWEIGRHGGVTLDGARKIVKILSKNGVICCVDWIMDGGENEPYTIKTQSIIDSLSTHGSKLIKEIMLFEAQNPNSIHTKITDKALHPLFDINDYVAGVKADIKKDMEYLIGKPCIVETSKKIYTRVFGKNTSDQHMLISLDSTKTNEYPIIQKPKILAIAPISRIYKPTNLY